MNRTKYSVHSKLHAGGRASNIQAAGKRLDHDGVRRYTGNPSDNLSFYVAFSWISTTLFTCVYRLRGQLFLTTSLVHIIWNKSNPLISHAIIRIWSNYGDPRREAPRCAQPQNAPEALPIARVAYKHRARVRASKNLNSAHVPKITNSF